MIVVTVAPVAEELLFRGALAPRFAATDDTGVGAFVSALVFAAVHPLLSPTIGSVIAIRASSLGLLSAAVAIRTGNLSASILLHAGFNLLTAVSVLAAADAAPRPHPRRLSGWSQRRPAPPSARHRTRCGRSAVGVLPPGVVGPARVWTGAAIVVACRLFVLFQLQPDLLLRNTTPAGGDTGAHVWWPAYLRDHLLPQGRIAGWAPDWFAGFPAGQFYFPFPALLIVGSMRCSRTTSRSSSSPRWDRSRCR